jgi:molybdopterin synthase catalytic subunit
MNEAGVEVNVVFFASAREIIGERLIRVKLPSPATVQNLIDYLCGAYPEFQKKQQSFIYAVNQEFVDADAKLLTTDEVGVFPPVSGGAGLPDICLITADEIDLNQLSRQIQAVHTGAAVIFTGYVRGESPGTDIPKTDRLDYEAYQPMAEKMMRQICSEIREKWQKVYGIFLVQRVGNLTPGEITTAIGVSTGHRGDGGFEAARYGIDRLKEIVPVWKKEITHEGEHWVEGHYRPDGRKSS